MKRRLSVTVAGDSLTGRAGGAIGGSFVKTAVRRVRTLVIEITLARLLVGSAQFRVFTRLSQVAVGIVITSLWTLRQRWP